MLLPKKMPDKVSFVVYPIVCALYGLMFGVLYAPVQALVFGYNFDMMIKWIVFGMSFDVLHLVGNFAAGFLVLPISRALVKLETR